MRRLLVALTLTASMLVAVVGSQAAAKASSGKNAPAKMSTKQLDAVKKRSAKLRIRLRGGQQARAQATVVLPLTFRGMYAPAAGETTTCAVGQMRDMSVRVTTANNIIERCDFLNATRDRTRPATIDGSGSTNLTVRNVTIRGDDTQQNQAFYMQGGTGFKAQDVTCIDPGQDRYFDHCMYLNNTKNFLIERLTCTAANGACIHPYSGGATGIVRDSTLGRACWNAVPWGSGNLIRIENSTLRDAVLCEGGRGLAVESASGAVTTLANVTVCGAATTGNVAGKPGLRTNGGTFVFEGTNTFSATCTAPPQPQCANGVNDDPAEDTLIDFGNDPGCTSSTDNSELGNPPPDPDPTLCDTVQARGDAMDEADERAYADAMMALLENEGIC